MAIVSQAYQRFCVKDKALQDEWKTLERGYDGRLVSRIYPGDRVCFGPFHVNPPVFFIVERVADERAPGRFLYSLSTHPRAFYAHQTLIDWEIAWIPTIEQMITLGRVKDVLPFFPELWDAVVR